MSLRTLSTVSRASGTLPELVFSLTFSPPTKRTVGLHIHRFLIQGLNQLWMEKYAGKKIPESSKKQNLNLLQTGNYLHSIYIVLGIISNLETI